MKKIPDSEITARIYEGLKLAFKKLLEEKKKNKCTLVFSENGKIVYYTPK